MIEKIKKIPLNLQATSVYNFNELSLVELLNKFFTSINECIEVSNESINFLVWLKNEGLPNEVIKELTLMYQDGRLTDIINQLANDVNGKIELMNNKLTENISLINTSIVNLEIELNENLNLEVNNINNSLPNIDINGGIF